MASGRDGEKEKGEGEKAQKINALAPVCARALKGERAHGSRLMHRGKNVSLIGAIGLNGLLTQISRLGTTDGLTIDAFIAQKLVPIFAQHISGKCCELALPKRYLTLSIPPKTTPFV